MIELWELFLSFARAGLFGFGGGPAMIPLIQVEVVDLRGWLSPEEFLDAFAFGNALPGPIATKLAGYVGYQIAGWPGALAALAGTTLPTIAMMIALAKVYQRNRNHPAVQRFLWGVRPVVVALLALVVWQFWNPAMAPAAPPRFGFAPLYALLAVSLWLSLRSNLHPAWLILAAALIGVGLGS
jgi:chromate transporter